MVITEWRAKYFKRMAIHALQSYKKENIVVARSLVVLNIMQAFVIGAGLVLALILAYKKIINGN